MLGWPLGDSSMKAGAAIMLNILGEASGQEGLRRAHEIMARAYKVLVAGAGLACAWVCCDSRESSHQLRMLPPALIRVLPLYGVFDIRLNHDLVPHVILVFLKLLLPLCFVAAAVAEALSLLAP